MQWHRLDPVVQVGQVDLVDLGGLLLEVQVDLAVRFDQAGLRRQVVQVRQEGLVGLFALGGLTWDGSWN